VPVITLTTDFGSESFYVAAIKGSLHRLIPNVHIVDLSNQIAPFDVAQAAFLIRNSYPSFPAKTIHLIGIDMDVNIYGQYLAVEKDGQFFIGADNGIFALVFDQEPEKVYRITHFFESKTDAFSGKNVFANAAAMLSQNWDINAIGEPARIKNFKENFQPMVDANSIRGHVVHIDHFKNVLTNISEQLFTKIARGRRFSIRFRRTEELDRISSDYSDVEPGERLCIFGETGFLEIAINRGEAAQLLGLRTGSVIIIEFL
jgi:S-adenosylmethionine hydrolase